MVMAPLGRQKMQCLEGSWLDQAASARSLR